MSCRHAISALQYCFVVNVNRRLCFVLCARLVWSSILQSSDISWTYSTAGQLQESQAPLHPCPKAHTQPRATGRPATQISKPYSETIGHFQPSTCYRPYTRYIANLSDNLELLSHRDTSKRHYRGGTSCACHCQRGFFAVIVPCVCMSTE